MTLSIFFIPHRDLFSKQYFSLNYEFLYIYRRKKFVANGSHIKNCWSKLILEFPNATAAICCFLTCEKRLPLLSSIQHRDYLSDSALLTPSSR